MQPSQRAMIKRDRVDRYKPGFMHAFFGLPTLLHERLQEAKRKFFEELNMDVILEIFRHFVAIQNDGAFVLTLVSSPWRDLVLGSPVLWQWVYIDERSEDWLEKAHICAAITASYPLQIVIRLPIVQHRTALSLFPRCQNLFFEIPDFMDGNDVRDNTRELLQDIGRSLNYSVHWTRAGKELRELREPLGSPMPDVMTMTLEADDHPNSPWRDPGDYLPLVQLTLYDVLDIFRNSPNLRTLVLSHNAMDHRSSDIDLPTVTMSNLRELEIRDMNNMLYGNFHPILQSIKCPNLLRCNFSGYIIDVLRAADLLSSVGTPPNLHLHFTDKYFHPDYAVEVPRDLGFVLFFSLELDEGAGSILAGKLLLKSLRNVISVGIELRIGSLDSRTKLPCIHHGHTSNLQPHSVSSKVDRTIQGVPCTLRVEEPYNLISISDAGRLQQLDLRNSGYSDNPCRILANASYTSVTTLMCEPFLLLPLLVQEAFPSLNTIQLHRPLKLELRYFDALGPYTIHFDTKIIDWMVRHRFAFPILQTLALEWFPDWKSFRTLLYCMSVEGTKEFIIKLPSYPHPVIQEALAEALSGIHNEARCVLPGRMSWDKYQLNSICHVSENNWSTIAAQASLDGNDPLPYIAATAFKLSPSGGVNLYPCYYCLCAGIRCQMDQKRSFSPVDGFNCSRHSVQELVTFTKDTFGYVEYDPDYISWNGISISERHGG